jgi:hypothetical protein
MQIQTINFDKQPWKALKWHIQIINAQALAPCGAKCQQTNYEFF